MMVAHVQKLNTCFAINLLTFFLAAIGLFECLIEYYIMSENNMPVKRHVLLKGTFETLSANLESIDQTLESMLNNLKGIPPSEEAQCTEYY